MPSVIAWLTDFGTRDHYVGTMKGVALGIAPEATLVDITHDIAPQDVRGGALELAAAFRYFPAGTVFVAVVDPGVGTARRAIAARAGGFSFVAPDNGLLTLALRDLPAPLVVELTNPARALPAVSRTFEGRDRFAPAGAWLARGTPIEDLGPGTDTWVQLAFAEPRVEGDAIRGEIARVDHFGNAITNVPRALVETWFAGGAVMVEAGGALCPLVRTYAEAGSNRPCALFSSSNHLEIAIAGGSAAEDLGLERGHSVVVRKTP